MSIKHIFKALVIASVTTLSAQTAVADITLKLGTTGRLGMPIGDAIDQALIPAMEKASGGKINNNYGKFFTGIISVTLNALTKNSSNIDYFNLGY